MLTISVVVWLLSIVAFSVFGNVKVNGREVRFFPFRLLTTAITFLIFTLILWIGGYAANFLLLPIKALIGL